MSGNERQDRLEGDLRRALQRIEAPAGFADTVAVRIRQHDAETSAGWWSRAMQALRNPAFATAAVAVLCLIVLAGGFEYRRHERQRTEGEAAKQQLMVAMRITGAKLHYAQKKVNEINSHQRRESRSRMEE